MSKEAAPESPAEEVTRLHRCLNDLASMTALAAVSTDGEPTQILSTLFDALLRTLRLAFVFVRLNDPDGGSSIEMTRVAESFGGAARGELSLASARVGVRGEIGLVVAGSERRDFPALSDRLVLDLAANQAAIRLQQAQLLSEQKRFAANLDERVAQRTSELLVGNERLRGEISRHQRAAEVLRQREQEDIDDRKRAEDARRASERNLKLIIDTVPALAWAARPDGSADFFNQHYLDFVGLSTEQAHGWGWTAAVHPDDLNGLAATWQRMMMSGVAGEAEARLRRHDGVYQWFLFRASPLRDETGTIVNWYGVNTNIEDRRLTEEALRTSERQFRLLVETIPALVWRNTPEGELDYLNRRAVEYLGHTAESLAGGRWLDLVHPDHRDATLQRWLHSATTGTSYGDEYQLRRADGQYRWIQSVGEPFHDTEGRIANWYGLVIDIEDRKRADVELRRAYDSFGDAQRLSRTGSFITDLVGDDHNWSEEAFRIFEFEPGSKVSVQRIRDIIHPDDLPSFESVIARGMTGENVTFAFRIVTSRGAVKHVRGVAHVVERVAGRPLFVGALQDVTESKEAEEALDRARSELARVARVTTVSALTASIAHEVNQPLSGIITNAGTCLRMLAADPPDVDGARETARRTLRDGNRASDVITRLRALFSKREFTLEPLDMNDVTREVVALSMRDLQRNRIVLQFEFADELPPITGDRIQLQQVVLNLLRNASDAMAAVDDRPRQLLIRTARDADDRVRVSVRDAGVGLDVQRMTRLFDAFYTTKVEGMGIGLSVSRSIIEKHHGRLWAEPNDGPGATFSFSIPVQEVFAGGPQAAAS